MRRGWEAVALMGLTCALLAVTEPGVVDIYGPDWLQPALLLAAALACVTVIVWPDNEITRAGSGLVVSAAFAWRAFAAVLSSRPLFAVILYAGFSLYITLTWHRVLPAPSSVRERVQEWQRDP